MSAGTPSSSSLTVVSIGYTAGAPAGVVPWVVSPRRRVVGGEAGEDGSFACVCVPPPTGVLPGERCGAEAGAVVAPVPFSKLGPCARDGGVRTSIVVLQRGFLYLPDSGSAWDVEPTSVLLWS